ncbi:hypothetical protein EAE96_003347 [Botrytis aclada]|nr:hypothetical protein EAE96_003347 [Botrytis aclada]
MLDPSYMYIQAQHIPYIYSTSQNKEAAKRTAKQQACKHILHPYSTTVTTASGPITSLYARHTRLCLAILHPQAPVHNMPDPSHINKQTNGSKRRSSSRSRSGFANPNPDPSKTKSQHSNIDTNTVISISAYLVLSISSSRSTPICTSAGFPATAQSTDPIRDQHKKAWTLMHER